MLLAPKGTALTDEEVRRGLRMVSSVAPLLGGVFADFFTSRHLKESFLIGTSSNGSGSCGRCYAGV